VGVGADRQGFGAFDRKPPFHVVGGERHIQCGVELVDDRPWRAGGRHNPIMQHRLVARQSAFGNGRQIGKQRERLAPVTAIARTLPPSFTSPAALAMVLNIMVTWPPTRSFSAGPEPL